MGDVSHAAPAIVGAIGLLGIFAYALVRALVSRDNDDDDV